MSGAFVDLHVKKLAGEAFGIPVKNDNAIGAGPA